MKDFTKMSSNDVTALLSMASGYPKSMVGDLQWELREVQHIPDDPNNVLHVDTFCTAIQVWLYAEDISDEQGPFAVVNGSRSLTYEKATWLFEVSNNVPKHGAGSYGSFRLLPPGDAASSENDEALKAPESLWGMSKRIRCSCSTPFSAQTSVNTDATRFEFKVLLGISLTIVSCAWRGR